jgi:hypothetical protein
VPLSIKGQIEDVLGLASKLQKYGTKKNIVSVFDDGGYRELLLATLFDLRLHLGRQGDDAYDELGNNFELKTVNLVDTSGKLRIKPGITTCHHVNQEIINRYRNLHAWLVGIFFINEPVEIYEISADKLESYLKTWEEQLKQSTHINNPKIRFDDIRKLGIKHYENKYLVEKYINGGIKRGIEVYKDVLSISPPDIKQTGSKLEATQ